MRSSKSVVLLVVATAAALTASSPTTAHPHTFVDARVDIVFDGQGRMKEIRQVWQFDQAFRYSQPKASMPTPMANSTLASGLCRPPLPTCDLNLDQALDEAGAAAAPTRSEA